MAVHLASKSLDWALTHIEQLGDTDIFPVPFEFEAIRECWLEGTDSSAKRRPAIRSYLENQDLMSWSFRTPRRALSPKHRFGFRPSTQLDPLDAIIYAAAVFEIGADLEAARVSPSKGRVHSYRFKPDVSGRMFDPVYGFDSFRRKATEIASDDAIGWVVAADIADFYPRLYSHPLENALSDSTSRTGHVKVLKDFLSHLNHSVSYGIPVGPAPSRLLAEVAIADVDAVLMSEGLRHLRFVDDFYLFCKSEREARSALALLANTLFEHHGLTLQQQKTYILKKADFLSTVDLDESDVERSSLTERFEAILKKLGLSNPCVEIDYEDLGEDTKAEIDGLNLGDILKEQVDSSESLDLVVTKFALRRLAQLKDRTAESLVLNNLSRLYPVFKECLAYLTSVPSAIETDRHEMGAKLLGLLDHNIVGHLEFHRAWVLSIFAGGDIWNNGEAFVPIYNKYVDGLSRRETILALGRAKRSAWFKSHKKNFDDYDP